MREYRGKKLDIFLKKDKGWAKGDLVRNGDTVCIVQESDLENSYTNERGLYDGEMTPVLPISVGQHTGISDKNGTPIYEGDIVSGLFFHCSPVNGIVMFKDGAFGLSWTRSGVETFNAFTSMCNVEFEVIGNIYDNPELIQGCEIPNV